jgi:predicted amidohydrolase
MRKRGSAVSGNRIPNGDFALGRPGEIPAGWSLRCARRSLAPVFKLSAKDKRQALLAAGSGSDDCVGWLSAPVTVRGGRTYRLRARFTISPGLDPQRSLLFAFYAADINFNNGIFRFGRRPRGAVEGEGRFRVPGKGAVSGDVRICFRLSARGKAWIEEVALEECAPIAPRLVRAACVQGVGALDDWRRVLDAAGRSRADLVLLPETMNGAEQESLRGPSARLMARKAAQFHMYVAGGIYCYDRKTNRLHNRALLFDRLGKRAGSYDKNHPFTPELLNDGVTPGTEVPVFKADFGTVGIMTCYDSWFPDVAELLALKGAELVLFPNVGYYRSLMPARAADNCVWLVTSSINEACGIWDTAGRKVTDPDADPSCYANHPPAFRAVRSRRVGKVRVLMATLDLSQTPSPHNWGGPMLSAPGGRRNRREQKRLLYDEIREEVERWWDRE